MQLVTQIKRRATSIAMQVFAACTVAYFAYHAFQGDRGFLAYMKLSQELKQAQQKHEEVLARKMALENRVQALRPEAIDPDMLEERARSVLNYGHENEVIIFYKEE